MAKVSIIEDDAILRDILANKLSQEGFAVSTASDGDQGISLIKQEKPDLVLLDILLPKRSGLEVLAEKNKDERLKNIPVIAISNSGDIGEIEKAKALGVQEFLIKAIFDSGDVVRKIKNLLGSQVGPQKSSPAQELKENKSELKTSPFEEHPTNGGVTTSGGNGDKRLVMIIEDDKFLRELASQKLEKDGFRVMGTATGQDALEAMKKDKPDVVILDLILPGMDGYEVLAKIREDAILGDVPVIILSNLGQEEDIAKAKKLGATDYLVKAHFSFGEIIKKIREVLGNVT